jgi:hypothetical protein
VNVPVCYELSGRASAPGRFHGTIEEIREVCKICAVQLLKALRLRFATDRPQMVTATKLEECRPD